MGRLSPLPANNSPPIVGRPGSWVGSGDGVGTAIDTSSPIAQVLPGTGEPGTGAAGAPEVAGAAGLSDADGAGAAAAAWAARGTSGPATATRLSSADPNTVRAR